VEWVKLSRAGTPAATSNSPTRGRVKLPHLRWRDGGTLLDGRALGNLRGSLLQTPALALELQQVSVVHQAVQ
jgi:hypothetical protein